MERRDFVPSPPMSFWTRNPYESSAKAAESLADYPSGGRIKMWLLGVALALAPIGYGVRCLVTEHATLIGSRGSRLEVTGSAAVAMAIAYMAVGLFIHAHWFWGLHPRLSPWSPVLKILTLLTFLAASIYAGYLVLSR